MPDHENLGAVVKKPVLLRCKRGHIFEVSKDNKPRRIELLKNAEVTHRTRPQCDICLIEWNDRQFGMDRIQ